MQKSKRILVTIRCGDDVEMESLDHVIVIGQLGKRMALHQHKISDQDAVSLLADAIKEINEGGEDAETNQTAETANCE